MIAGKNCTRRAVIVLARETTTICGVFSLHLSPICILKISQYYYNKNVILKMFVLWELSRSLISL
jgi:hypothetical protein